MWWFRRKRIKTMHEAKEKEAERIRADNIRRTVKATKPIAKLTRRFEQNHLIIEIRTGLGSRNV